MRRKIFILLMCCAACLCGYAAGSTKAAPEENYFFPKGMKSAKYKADILMSQGGEAEISITEIDRLEKGVLYQLKISCDDMDSFQGYYDEERFDLGYFFVQDDKIYSIPKLEAEKLESIKTGKTTIVQGALVCQDSNKNDPIEGEGGWHESIEIEGEQSIYRAYNDLTETGYYERFVWGRGQGLVEYRSGYGAGANRIELQRIGEP